MSGTANTIPASHYVNVTPSVVAAGGTGVDLIEIMLTTNTRFPVGQVLSFPSLVSVQNYTGAASAESVAAGVYFAGYTTRLISPNALLFTQYPLGAVSAYLRSGPAPTLAAIQAVTSGNIIISIDGTPVTSASLNFSTQSSLTSCGWLMSTGLGIVGNASLGSITASISGGTLTVTAVSSGTITIGTFLTGAGENAFYVTALGSGTGGTGTYSVFNAVDHGSETFTLHASGVIYDSVLNSFVISSPTTGASSSMSYATGSEATFFALTQATGAILSAGAIAAVPSTFMTGITAITTNWATFQTLFDPDGGSGNTVKQEFAAWVNTTNNRYAYLAWDTDITPTESTDATTSLGNILQQSDSSGTVCIYEKAGVNSHLAPFVGGYAASLDFDATNGRATAAYKSQSGIVPSVISEVVAANLEANGYNYYGAVATAGANWNFFYPGSISGPYAWLDSYLNQIWLNNQCQISLMTLQITLRRIPYNPVGYGYIRSTLTGGATGAQVALPPASPVAAALNNGVITANVPLSAEQAIAVNAIAGMKIDQILSSQGWYLVIQPATAAVRAARQSPTVILLYTDGQSVQKISLSSVLVQ